MRARGGDQDNTTGGAFGSPIPGEDFRVERGFRKWGCANGVRQWADCGRRKPSPGYAAPVWHKLSTGVGAGAGAATGAAIGAVAGPVGMAAGAAVGGIAGGLAGKGAGEVVNPKVGDHLPEHHLSKGVGAGGGALAGAAVGSAAGPVARRPVQRSARLRAAWPARAQAKWSTPRPVTSSATIILARVSVRAAARWQGPCWARPEVRSA